MGTHSGTTTYRKRTGKHMQQCKKTTQEITAKLSYNNTTLIRRLIDRGKAQRGGSTGRARDKDKRVSREVVKEGVTKQGNRLLMPSLGSSSCWPSL